MRISTTNMDYFKRPRLSPVVIHASSARDNSTSQEKLKGRNISLKREELETNLSSDLVHKSAKEQESPIARILEKIVIVIDISKNAMSSPIEKEPSPCINCMNKTELAANQILKNPSAIQASDQDSRSFSNDPSSPSFQITNPIQNIPSEEEKRAIKPSGEITSFAELIKVPLEIDHRQYLEQTSLPEQTNFAAQSKNCVDLAVQSSNEPSEKAKIIDKEESSSKPVVREAFEQAEEKEINDSSRLLDTKEEPLKNLSHSISTSSSSESEEEESEEDDDKKTKPMEGSRFSLLRWFRSN